MLQHEHFDINPWNPGFGPSTPPCYYEFGYFCYCDVCIDRVCGNNRACGTNSVRHTITTTYFNPRLLHE
jgi:hypothetical protein